MVRSTHKLLVANVEEALPREDLLFSYYYDETSAGMFARFLAELHPGDMLVVPWPLDADFCAYMDGLIGLGSGLKEEGNGIIRHEIDLIELAGVLWRKILVLLLCLIIGELLCGDSGVRQLLIDDVEEARHLLVVEAVAASKVGGGMAFLKHLMEGDYHITRA